jgi:hypothetical protein
MELTRALPSALRVEAVSPTRIMTVYQAYALAAIRVGLLIDIKSN